MGRGSRRRLSLQSHDDEEEEPEDPIAAAIAAKKQREVERLRLVATAAAKAFDHCGKTTFFVGDDSPRALKFMAQLKGVATRLVYREILERLEQQILAAEALKPTSDASSSVEDQKVEQQEAPNPLANLLGYGEDEKSSAFEAASADKAAVQQGQGAGSDKGTSLDAEFSSFMDELEASGLLKEEEEGEVTVLSGRPTGPSADAPDGMPSSDAPAGSDAGTEAIASAAEAPKENGSGSSVEEERLAGKAVAAEGAVVEGDGKAPAEEEAAAAVTAGEDGGPAEQRVLGFLEGLPDWSEVMDMGSGKVYFWNSATDEVAWDPPEGSVPRSKQDTDALFAAEQDRNNTAADTMLADESAAGPQSPGAAELEEGEVAPPPQALSPQQQERLAEVARQLAEAAQRLLGGEISPAVRLAVEAQLRVQDCAVATKPAVLGDASLAGYLKEQALVVMEQGASLLRLVEEEAARPRSDTRDATPGDATFPEVGPPSHDAMEADSDALPPLPVEDAGTLNTETLNGSLGEEEAPPPLPDSPLPPDPEAADSPFSSSHPVAAEGARMAATELAAAPSLLHPSPAQDASPDDVALKRKREAITSSATVAKKKKLAGAKMGKNASSLINKWAAVAKEMAPELEEEEPERRRAREAEEWRLKQLRAGVAPQENANFQPLAGDWRSRLKTTKKGGSGGSAREVPPGDAQNGGVPDLAALSAGLPQGWKALFDKDSGEVYYGNPGTKETTWERPT